MVNNPTNINKAKLSSELTERTRYVLAWDSHTNVAGLNRVLYSEKPKQQPVFFLTKVILSNIHKFYISQIYDMGKNTPT